MACRQCGAAHEQCGCRTNTIICRQVAPAPVCTPLPCPCIETPNVGAATNTVQVVTSGLLDRVIAANVKLSALAGNSIIANGDGLYAPAAPAEATLTDNGDRTYTFNNNVDAPTTFCQGLTEIVAGAGCNGIGSGNMVRSATLSDCALTLSSAPEHTTGYNIGAQSGIAYLPLPAGTTRILNQDILIQNPSTCRSFVFRLIQEAVIEIELLADAECVVSTFNNPVREGGPGSSRIRRGITRVAQAIGTLAPGASTIVNVFIDVELVSGTVNIYGSGQTIGYVGGTV